MNILLIEDNLTIVKGLKYSLERNNYNVVYKTNIKESIEYLDNSIDLIILDISLPDGDGINLYEKYIKNKNIPVIFLTAQDEEETIVKCLNLGAEDYVVKPFRTNELLARINRILMRVKNKNIIKVNDIVFDADKMIVYKNNDKIELTSLEIHLLNLLFLNINKVVSRNDMLELIWDITGNDVDEHTVTVYMKRIKDKLGNDIITTIKGIGYIIDNEK